MTVIETQHRHRFGQVFTLVMVEGAVNDVAVYEHTGRSTAIRAMMEGLKWSEHQNAVDGIRVPDGKHYRQ